MTSAPAIGFDYRPSRLPARLLLAVAVLALVAIAASGAPWMLKLLMAAVSIALATHALRRAARSTVTGVALAGESWTLYRAARSESPAVLASFRILGTCVLLRLKSAERVEVLLLAPDNSDADLRRRLRMRLAAMQPVGSAAHS
jgi:toxin CptA